MYPYDVEDLVRAAGEIPAGKGIIVETDRGNWRDLLGRIVDDPGPGHWDRCPDLATETPGQNPSICVDGRIYLTRNHSTSTCPSGKCGNEITLVPTTRRVEHTAHSLERCAERGIDPDTALRIASQTWPRTARKVRTSQGERHHVFQARVDDVLVEVAIRNGRIVSVYRPGID